MPDSRINPQPSKTISSNLHPLGAPPAGLLAVLILLFPLRLWSQQPSTNVADPQSSTIYVDSQLGTATSTQYDPGSRASAGGSATAYLTLGAALPAATAGTTVIIRSGTYSDPLAPVHSGEEGRVVVFRCQPGEYVYLKAAPAISLSSRSHLVIDGLQVENTTWLESRDSHHNVVQNCRFFKTPATGTTGNARFIQSHYNRIRNNRFEDGNDNLLLIDSNFNVVEGNTILQGRHSVLGIRCGDNNIIRGNYLANSIQKIAEVYDCGQDTSAVPNSFNSTKRNVFENNVFADASSYYSTSGGNGIQYSGQQGIIRHNVFYQCNVGLGMQTYADEALHNRDNHIYHNVFYDNDGAGISTGGGTTGNTYKNNILFANKGLLADCFSLSPGQIAYRGSLGVAARFERNDLFYQQQGQPVIEEEFNIGRSVSQAAAAFPGVLQNTLEVDPGFVDAAGHDFHLRPDSPLRDAGAWLTTTTSGGSGTTLAVANAQVFQDGFGIPGESGDLIQLEGQTQTARIVRINDLENTLVVDRELSWSAGQGVGLPFAGSQPDVGAFESALTPDGMEEWRQLHFGDDAGNPDIAGDLADPDGDGLNNLLEYGLGGDPLTTDPSVLPVPGTASGRFGLVIRRDGSLTDLTFTVQTSESPSDADTWTNIAESIGGAQMKNLAPGFTVTETGTGTGFIRIVAVAEDATGSATARRFMRLRISRNN